jgi:hypothetical protein
MKSTRTAAMLILAATLMNSCDSYWGAFDNPNDPLSELWIEPTPVIFPSELRLTANPGTSTPSGWKWFRIGTAEGGVLRLIDFHVSDSWLELGFPGDAEIDLIPYKLMAVLRAEGLSAGSYNGTITVSYVSNKSSELISTLSIPLTADIVAGPLIAASENALWFTAPNAGTYPETQTVSVTNGGEGSLGSLSVSVEAAAAGWLFATLDSASAPATLSVQPREATFTTGRYNGKITISSAGAANSPLELPVWFTVP